MIFFFFYNSGCSNFEPHILWLCLCCCVCYDDQRFYMAEMMRRIYFCKNVICFRFESNITNRRTNVGLVHYFHFLWCAIDTVLFQNKHTYNTCYLLPHFRLAQWFTSKSGLYGGNRSWMPLPRLFFVAPLQIW